MIWIIGGTSDARLITEKLADRNNNVLVSTTTNYGSVLAKHANVKVVQKCLCKLEMFDLIEQNHINLVIDASHPYAAEVSKNAIDVCVKSATRYIRYERENTLIDGVVYYESYSEIINELQKEEGIIFLTTGSKNVKGFSEIIDRCVARVLPVESSITECREAGLLPHQIIASKGVWNENTNKAIFDEYNAKHLVTKDSGISGGVPQKVNAALSLGLKVHVLAKPNIEYPEVYFNVDNLLLEIKN